MIARLGRLKLLAYLADEVPGLELDYEARNREFKTILHEAAQFGQLEVARKILASGKASVDALKRADWTPLMLATTKTGNVELVRLLLDHGATPQLANKDGWTAFHLAAREGDVPTLKLLLERDPDLWRTRSRNGRTPLHSAGLANSAALPFLLDACAPYDPDCADSCGSTPLMDYVRSGHVCLLARFLARNHRPAAVDKMGRNCLDIASNLGQVDAIRALTQDHGMSLGRLNDARMSCLHWAAFGNQPDALEYLVSLGVDRELKDSKGRTALDIAAENGYARCVAVLNRPVASQQFH